MFSFLCKIIGHKVVKVEIGGLKYCSRCGEILDGGNFITKKPEGL